MYSLGMHAEHLFQELIIAANYDISLPAKVDSKIKEYAIKHFKACKNVNYNRQDNGLKPLSFEKSKDILDHLLKVDTVINIPACLIGLQLTTQPVDSFEFKTKLSTVRNMQKACLQIGFKWTTLVHITLSSGEETLNYKFRTDLEKEVLLDSFYNLIDLLIEQLESEKTLTPLYITI